MKNLANKSKIFFVVALALIVAGMAILGFLGLNRPVDYKKSYEMQISVDQNVDVGEGVKASEIMFNAANDYFKQNGVNPKDYATQTMDDGAIVVFKFGYDVSDKVDAVKTAVNDAIDLKNDYINADVKVNEVTGKSNIKLGYILVACGVAIVAIFLYALAMEKLAGAVATLFSTVLSAVLFISVMSVARIPAQPFITVTCVVSALIAGIISVATVNRYKEEVKNSANDKATAWEIAESVSRKEFISYIFVLCLIALVGIVVGLIGWMHMLFVGIQLIVASIVGVSSAFFGTPMIWALIKKSKK